MLRYSATSHSGGASLAALRAERVLSRPLVALGITTPIDLGPFLTTTVVSSWSWLLRCASGRQAGTPLLLLPFYFFSSFFYLFISGTGRSRSYRPTHRLQVDRYWSGIFTWTPPSVRPVLSLLLGLGLLVLAAAGGGSAASHSKRLPVRVFFSVSCRASPEYSKSAVFFSQFLANLRNKLSSLLGEGRPRACVLCSGDDSRKATERSLIPALHHECCL